MSSEKDDLKRIRWISFISRKLDDFEETLDNNKESSKYFDIDYIDRVAEKASELDAVNTKLSLVSYAILISLYTVTIHPDIDINFAGLEFKNLAKAKEVLLFIMVILMPIISVHSCYIKYLKGIVDRCALRLVESPSLHNYYRYSWINEFMDPLLLRLSDNQKVSDHRFTSTLVVLFGITALSILVVILLAALIMTATVIYDVATNPVSSATVNRFVVIFACVSVLFSWLVEVMQFPLPVIDMTYYDKLSELETNSPEKYNQHLRNSFARNEKLKKVFLVFYSISSYVVTYVATNFFDFSMSSEMSPLTVLSSNWLQLLATAYLSFECYTLFEKILWHFYFIKVNPGTASDLKHLNRFIRYQRMSKVGLFVVPLLVAILTYISIG